MKEKSEELSTGEIGAEILDEYVINHNLAKMNASMLEGLAMESVGGNAGRQGGNLTEHISICISFCIIKEYSFIMQNEKKVGIGI